MNEKLIEHNQLQDRSCEPNFSTYLLSPYSSKIDATLMLEQSVWYEKKYGSLEEYEKFLPQSRIFGSFDNQENCLGVVRVFQGTPELPPFMEMPFEDETLREKLAAGCQSGLVEELGTAAVAKDAPIAKVALNLWRLAYRDADLRGIRYWGVIMEPKRVSVINRRYGFTFTQAGPEVNYQGGNCAAHILDLEEASANMSVAAPKYHEWFVNEPLH